MRLRVVIQRRGLIRTTVPLRPLVKLSSCDKQQRSFSHPKLLTGQLPNRRATPSYPLRRHQLLFAPASPNLTSGSRADLGGASGAQVNSPGAQKLDVS